MSNQKTENELDRLDRELDTLEQRLRALSDDWHRMRDDVRQAKGWLKELALTWILFAVSCVTLALIMWWL